MADQEMSKIKKLKSEMKRWEKHFEQMNGRKARKEDIDKDETMKQAYIHYWKVIKNKGPKSTKKGSLKKSFICLARLDITVYISCFQSCPTLINWKSIKLLKRSFRTTMFGDRI